MTQKQFLEAIIEGNYGFTSTDKDGKVITVTEKAQMWLDVLNKPKKSKAKVDNTEYEGKILECFADNTIVKTATEVAKELDLTTSKASVVMRGLVEKELLSKIDNGRNKPYSYKLV